jgi:hypothetical protein
MLVQRPTPDPAGIGGTYCYRSAALNVRGVRPQTSGFTGIPMRQVADSSPLDVAVIDSTVFVSYTDVSSRQRKTVLLPMSGPASGELRIELPNRGGGASFGVGSAKRWMTLTRGTDGTLVYIEWYQEKALAFFLLPMHETTARSVVFDRC